MQSELQSKFKAESQIKGETEEKIFSLEKIIAETRRKIQEQAGLQNELQSRFKAESQTKGEAEEKIKALSESAAENKAKADSLEKALIGSHRKIQEQAELLAQEREKLETVVADESKTCARLKEQVARLKVKDAEEGKSQIKKEMEDRITELQERLEDESDRHRETRKQLAQQPTLLSEARAHAEAESNARVQTQDRLKAYEQSLGETKQLLVAGKSQKVAYEQRLRTEIGTRQRLEAQIAVLKTAVSNNAETCECCDGKFPAGGLVEIDSGQKLCQNCIKELRK